MDHWHLLADLQRMSPEETFYKKLFKEKPEAYRKWVQDWAGFVKIYKENGGKEDLPEEAPTIIGGELKEKDWFLNPDREVTVVKNARYCPPFFHSLEFIKIVFPLQGSFLFMTENEKMEIRQGDFLIVCPDVGQTVLSFHDEDIIVNVLIKASTFRNSFSSLLAEQARISDFFWQMLYSRGGNRIMLFQCRDDARLSQIILDIITESAYEENPSNFLLKSYVMLFFAYVLRNHGQDIVMISQGEEKRGDLPEIIRFIKKNSETVTMVSLAEHFQKSEGFLSRYIKKETGKTFSQLLREFKLRKAADILKNSDCSIEAVAEAAGYTDLSSFYRSFKEMYGMPPAAYRVLLSG